jgi:hypothetical protein
MRNALCWDFLGPWTTTAIHYHVHVRLVTIKTIEKSRHWCTVSFWLSPVLVIKGMAKLAFLKKKSHTFLTVNMWLEAFAPKKLIHIEPPHRCAWWLYSQWPQTGDNSHVPYLVKEETGWGTAPLHSMLASDENSSVFKEIMTQTNLKAVILRNGSQSQKVLCAMT